MQRARGGRSESTDVRQLQTLGRLANSQSEFKTRDKRVFHAVAQVPVATGAQAVDWVVLMRHTQWCEGFGIEPAVHVGVSGFSTDACELCKRTQEFGFDTRFGVIDVLGIPSGAGLYRPAFHLATAWLG